MSEIPFETSCRTYCCSYFHDGSWWGVSITAYDWADAEVRARKLSLRLDGELQAIVPADVPGSGLVVRVATFIRNRLFGRVT